MKRSIKERITGALQVRLRKGAYGPVMVVMAVLGLALAIMLYLRTTREQQESARLAFEHRAKACAAEIDREDDRGEALVAALGGYVEATQRMDRDRFRIFCTAVDRRDNRAQALEWVPRVPHDRREEYEAAARDEGLAGFRFTERGTPGGTVPADLRDEYFPAYYVEPLAGNEADVGFDLGSDPARLAALLKAAQTGGLVATPRLTLDQGTGTRFGYMMAQPVYETGASLETAEDRRQHVRGFVLGVFRIDAIVESALAEKPPAGLDLYLFDDAAPAAQRFLYLHPSRTRSDPTEAGLENLSKPVPFEYRTPISAADRTWTLVIRPAPAFLAAHRSGEAYAVAAAVAIFTAAAVGLMFLLGRAARYNVLLMARQTESRHLQDALKGSEARYRILFESSGDAIMTLEPPSWRFTSANPATVSMFKAENEQNFTAHEPWTLSPERQPDGRLSGEKAKEMIETAMRDGSHFFEWKHKRINGESFAATVLLSRMETDGKVLLQASVRDITEAKRAQAQIESLHRRNEIILNSAGEGIYGVDLEGNTTFVNLAALKLLGYTREELIGKAPHALIHHTHPDGRPYPGEECPIYAAFTDGRVHHVAADVFWRKDGASFPVEYFSNPMRDEQGALIGAVVTFNDITTRKQVELALRESNRLIEGIINTIPVRVFWKDKSLTYLGCNRAFARDAGFSNPEDMIGKDDFQMAWRDQAELYRSDDHSVLASGQPRLLIEEPQTTPAGDTIWLLTSKVPLRDPSGEICGVLGTYMDMTEHKRMEEQQQALAEQLRKEQKLAAVGTLACGMGHEINNPILGIINYAQLIKDRLQGKHANVEEFAGEIVIEAERIAGLVRGLSAFATRDTAARVSVPVTDLIESALAPLRDPPTHEQIALEVDLPDNLPSLVCDRGQIAQVMTSLLDNARDALNEKYPEGDADKIVRISARVVGDRLPVSGEQSSVIVDESSVSSQEWDADTDHGSLTTDHSSSPRWLRLTVEDHGTGIPPDVREHIFEPFFTTKDKSVGAGNIGKGLGLFVSHATVQNHGGVLSVESEVGQWTRFCVDLPADGSNQIE